MPRGKKKQNFAFVEAVLCSPFSDKTMYLLSLTEAIAQSQRWHQSIAPAHPNFSGPSALVGFHYQHSRWVLERGKEQVFIITSMSTECCLCARHCVAEGSRCEVRAEFNC